ACTGTRCAFYDRCPGRLARAKLDDAQVIVANHALVLADLQLPAADGERGGVILPTLKEALLVVDEGHRLAEYAIDAGASHVHLASTRKRVAKWAKTISLAFRLT